MTQRSRPLSAELSGTVVHPIRVFQSHFRIPMPRVCRMCGTVVSCILVCTARRGLFEPGLCSCKDTNALMNDRALNHERLAKGFILY